MNNGEIITRSNSSSAKEKDYISFIIAHDIKKKTFYHFHRFKLISIVGSINLEEIEFNKEESLLRLETLSINISNIKIESVLGSINSAHFIKRIGIKNSNIRISLEELKYLIYKFKCSHPFFKTLDISNQTFDKSNTFDYCAKFIVGNNGNYNYVSGKVIEEGLKLERKELKLKICDVEVILTNCIENFNCMENLQNYTLNPINQKRKCASTDVSSLSSESDYSEIGENGNYINLVSSPVRTQDITQITQRNANSDSIIAE